MTAPPPAEHVVHLPVDNVLAAFDAVAGRLHREGLLPRRRPAAAVPRLFALPAGKSRQATSVANVLLGYALSENTGQAAVVELRNGTDANADLLARVPLAGDASTGLVWVGPDGIAVDSLYVVVTGLGTVDIAVYLGEV